MNNIEKVYTEWNQDSIIDISELEHESIRTAKLHNKYIKAYTNAKLKLIKFESEYKVLKKDKFDFYIDGPSEETQKNGWEYPKGKKILKVDVNLYLDSDKELIDLLLKIEYQKELVHLLKEILNVVHSRNYAIRDAIEVLKFKNGVG